MTAKKRKRKKRKAKSRRRRRDLERKQASKPAAPQEEEVDFSDIWDIGIPDDPEEAIATFQEVLEAGELDAEASFEWLSQIRDALGGEDPAARAQFGALVDQLRRQAPELYADNAPYFIDALLGDAIADNCQEAIPDLLAPFAEELDRHADAFFNEVIDQLLYHGQTEALRDVMRQAWPRIQDSKELVPWAADEFAGQAMLVELFTYLETAADPRPDDPALLDATTVYREWRAGWLEQHLPRLTSPAPSPWQRTDFDATVDADRWNESLRWLLLEFVADRWRAGVPLSRGYMAHIQLGEFLNWQFSDPDISDDTEDWLQRRGKQRRRRKKKERRAQPSEFSLVPRRALLDRFAAQKFPLLGSEPYKVAALMELVPAYLHFLARLDVIHPTEMDEALEKLSPLMEHLPQILRNYGADPVAIQNLTTAWDKEALTTLRDDPALASARAVPLPEPVVPASIPTPKPGALDTYTFKVTYLPKPDVWRSIEMAGDQTLDDLHYAIQSAVNFNADHMYSFFMSGRAWDDTTEYAAPYGEGRSAASVKIRDLGLRMKQRFLYLFDYGDEHRFEVQLIAVNPDAPKGEYPRVVERRGRNPKQYGGW